MGNGLGHVVEVDLGGVLDVGALPVGEGVGQDQVDAALDDGIAGAISPLVPRIGSADLGALGQHGADVVDLLEQLLAGEVAAVQRLGADGDGVDLVGVLVGGVRLEGLLVGLERLVDIGPACFGRVASALLVLPVAPPNNLMRHA